MSQEERKTTTRHFDIDPTEQCAICGKQVSTKADREDHIVEEHPDGATPELRDSYNQRRRGTASDGAAWDLTSIGLSKVKRTTSTLVEPAPHLLPRNLWPVLLDRYETAV